MKVLKGSRATGKKWRHLFFRCLRAANSVVIDWPKFELIHNLIAKNEEYPTKNEEWSQQYILILKTLNGS